MIKILSSIGPISNNSTIDAINPAIAPPKATPLKVPKPKPRGTHAKAIKIFPMGCLLLFLKATFLIIPVIPSPNDMNKAGMIAIHLYA